ncbi:MAG: protein kinase [Burkholderiales bacterium]|nr:protein kinase [Burkholderiales bacterium]
MPPTSAATSMPTTAAPSVTTGGPNHALTLEAGTRLGEFEVTKTIGEGGFGIVYLAWDHSLERKVALKEYMPTSLAYRAGPTDIKPRSERHQETFEAGLKSFINEAKLLAQFDHPSLLKVHRFWQANGTAYMVMPFLEGKTVRDTVRGLPSPPDEAWILGLLAPLFDALVMLHTAQIYHRDIAPDNVLLMADTGRPLLLDFGAARRVIGDMTQALTAILKPGYAPVEQYADMPGLKQGPWTDVYALAAVVHWMIMGKTPPPSVGRLFDDPYVPLAQSAAGRYSDAFLRAIDHGLAVMPEKRTTSIEAMRVELFGGTLPTSAPAPVPGAGAGLQDVPRSQPHTRTETQRLERTQQIPLPTQRQERAEATAAPQPGGGSKLPLVAGGLGLVVVAALAAFALWPKATPPGPTATSVPAVVTPSTVVAPAASAITASMPAPTSVVATPARIDTPAVQAPASAAPPSATVAPATLPSRDTPPAPDATRPSADPDTKPVARKPPPTRTETPPQTRERPAAPVEARPVEPKVSDNAAECARIFQLISLGQADQSVMDRFRTLRCR